MGAFECKVVRRWDTDAVVTVAMAVAAVAAAVSLLGDVALKGKLVVGPVKVYSLLRDRLTTALSTRNTDALDNCGLVIFGRDWGVVGEAHLKPKQRMNLVE